MAAFSTLHADTLLGWVLIGAAASLAGMIWPFRRGTTGIVINLFAGIVGAVLAGLLSLLLLRHTNQGRTPTSLVFAAIGALAALVAVHVAQMGAVRRGRI